MQRGLRMTRSELRVAVVQSVTLIATRHGFKGVVEDSVSIIDALGLDSLRMVDLTVELEDRLGVAAFPMQDWVDAEAESVIGVRYTVGSLIACASGLCLPLSD